MRPELELIFREYFSSIAGQSGSCTKDEFLTILSLLLPRTPCNLLVFGVGNDSLGWTNANRHGLTVFIEDDPRWTANIDLPTAEIVHVKYTAPRPCWRFLIEDSIEKAISSDLALDLPKSVWDCPWDFIFVDAPLGVVNRGPGRHSSIYTASCLANTRTIVAIHDCDRVLENVASTLLLGTKFHVSDYGRLRVYNANQRQ